VATIAFRLLAFHFAKEEIPWRATDKGVEGRFVGYGRWTIVAMVMVDGYMVTNGI
jgi:hypothetical protein